VNVDTGSISIIVVDDHTLFREGLTELLASEPTFRVIAQGSDSADALALTDQYYPDAVLVDVEMPGPGAPATVRRLHQKHPDTRVIVLTMHDKPELVLQLLDEGAAAYLVKTISRLELIAAVRSVVTIQGKIVLSVSRETINQLNQSSPDAVLSVRELEVLRLTALAMSNAQIGKKLIIAEGTVKRHLTNIYAKLGAVSRVDAIRKATAAGLIPRVDS
jgi:DNA-binding NarL/FixJ family response regulator